MRIKEIKVEGLFDMFDHTITLNMEHQLTIVYGANGVGKTMIFRLLDWFFDLSPNVIALYNAPFNSLQIRFINDSLIEISKENENVLVKYQNKGKEKVFNLLGVFNEENNKAYKKFIQYINKKTSLKYVDGEDFYDTETDKLITLNEVLEKHKNIISEQLLNGFKRIPKELIDIIYLTKLNFIETQRLTFTSENNYYNDDDDEKIVKDTVTEYAKELVKIIETQNEKYRKLSDDLKNSLSIRILSKQVKTDVDVKTLNQLVKEVEQKRNKYIAVGLIEGNSNNFEIPDDIGELDRAILAVNIQDMLTQLAIYEEDNFYERLELFIEILNNRRLSYKSIKISEQHGFTFTNAKGKELKPDNLSSGEQHELVLLYQLLFKIPENSLILIDEPEISLHITWQKEFTKDMEDIIKLRNFDILLATHSPAIINGNWEITQSLDGYEEE